MKLNKKHQYYKRGKLEVQQKTIVLFHWKNIVNARRYSVKYSDFRSYSTEIVILDVIPQE